MQLEEQLDCTLNNDNINHEEKTLSAALLQEHIIELQKQRYNTKNTKSKVQNHLHDKTISKYWINLNKSRRPRDIIYELKEPNSSAGNPTYKTKTSEIVEIARNYHNDIQSTDIPTIKDANCNEIITKVTQKLENKISEVQKQEFGKNTQQIQVQEAIAISANNVAAGIDGLPNELPKTLVIHYREDKLVEKLTFNIVKVLIKVFNDIEKYGIIESTDFNTG